MDIVYIFDELFFYIAYSSFLSLLENFPKNKKLYAHFVLVNVSVKHKDELLQHSTKNIKINLYDYDIDLLKDFPDTAATKNTYIRLLLPDIIKPVSDRILYLDCDTHINSDVSELEDFMFNDKILAMCSDYIPNKYTKHITESINYYNAGIILYNGEYFNTTKYVDEMKLFLHENDISKFRYADQDILNHLYKTQIAELPLKYNVMTIYYLFNKYSSMRNAFKDCSFANSLDEKIFNNIKTEPSIIHYSGSTLIRPWYSNSHHPYRESFRKFLSSEYKQRKYRQSFYLKIDTMFRNILPEKVYSKIYNLEIKLFLNSSVHKIKKA